MMSVIFSNVKNSLWMWNRKPNLNHSISWTKFSARGAGLFICLYVGLVGHDIVKQVQF